MQRKETNVSPKKDFIALYTKDIPWEDDTRLDLPKGVKMKILFEDPEIGRQDVLVKFPPGYVEPLHTHESSHSIVVLEGKMCVAGKELVPGDYVFGWDKEHGPYHYPEGCTVFVTFLGKGISHKYDKEK
jgi:anti-sigma factor ChrR (cupin superfamily)